MILIAVAFTEIYNRHLLMGIPRGPKPGWRPLPARMGKEDLIPRETTRLARLRHRLSRLAALGRHRRR